MLCSAIWGHSDEIPRVCADIFCTPTPGVSIGASPRTGRSRRRPLLDTPGEFVTERLSVTTCVNLLWPLPSFDSVAWVACYGGRVYELLPASRTCRRYYQPHRKCFCDDDQIRTHLWWQDVSFPVINCSSFEIGAAVYARPLWLVPEQPRGQCAQVGAVIYVNIRKHMRVSVLSHCICMRAVVGCHHARLPRVHCGALAPERAHAAFFRE